MPAALDTKNSFAHKASAASKTRTLNEQRSAIAAPGPSVAPSMTISMSNPDTKIVKALIEQHTNNFGAERFKSSNEVFSLENRVACNYLVDSFPTHKVELEWACHFVAYLAAGGPCPPLNVVSIRQKSMLLPATVPIHLLLRDAFQKPRSVCFVEPVVPYFRSFVRRSLCVPNPSTALESYGPYYNSQAESLSECNGEKYTEKEAMVVDELLRQRFGSNVKTSSTIVTHTTADVVRLAFGFASGLRGYLENLESRRGDGVASSGDDESSSDSDDDSIGKQKDSETETSPDTPDRATTTTVKSPAQMGLKTESFLPIRIACDVASVDAKSAEPGSLYRQNKRSLGKVRSDTDSSTSAEPITYPNALGVLMTAGIESFVISLGCPIADIVQYPIDPSAFTPETLCDILKHSKFSTIVCDDIGFELLAKAHALWRSMPSSCPWPIEVVLTSILFEDHRPLSAVYPVRGFDNAKKTDMCADDVQNFDVVAKFALTTQIYNLSDIIVPNLRLSIMRLIRYRSSNAYSVTKLPNPNEPSLVAIHPRALAVTYDHETKKYFPLWSNAFMASVGGVLALEDSLHWDLSRSDTILTSRIEMPSGDALKSTLDLEAASINHLAAAVLAVGGRVGAVPMARLMFNASAVQDSVRKMKPTISVGSNHSWALFTKRLAHAAGVDGAGGAKSWKHRLIEKRSGEAWKRDYIEDPKSQRKTNMKESLLRHFVDPVAFRQGRQLLGSSIRLAVVVDPVNGSEVMHEKSLATLLLLLSSSKRCRVVQAYSISELGGHPMAMMSSPLQTNQQRRTSEVDSAGKDASTMPLHVGERTFNPKFIEPRLLNVLHVPLSSDMVDASVSAPTTAACSINGALEVMMTGSDESYLPDLVVPSCGSNPDEGYTTPLSITPLTEVVQCRIAKSLRFTNRTEKSMIGSEPHAFVGGSYAQLQHGCVAGPLFTRVCLDSDVREVLRLNSINNFLQIHCFPIIAVRSLKRSSRAPLETATKIVISGTAAQGVEVPRPRHPKSGTISVDLILELNPLSTDSQMAHAELSNLHDGPSKQLISERGAELNIQLNGSLLQHYSLLWPQGVLPDEAWIGHRPKVPSDEEAKLLKTIPDSTRQSIESVIAMYGANLTLNQCLALNNN